MFNRKSIFDTLIVKLLSPSSFYKLNLKLICFELTGSSYEYRPYQDAATIDIFENYGVRLKAQIKVLEKLNEELNLMTTSQKVDWLLQDRETIEHNKKVVNEQTYNRQQVNKMLQLMHSPCSSMERIEVS